ncbi:MAG: ABC transporter ATP-binding protein, partial [Lachnospiraceae bacterium]|nr:ABC transporter ATP-binding protein [Lachnospiraceae bacterium]
MARNKINEDEYLEESFDLEQLKRLGKYVGAFKGKLSLAVGIMIVSSGLSMLIPIFMKNVMDIVTESNFGNGLGENEAIQKIIFYSVLTFVITVVCALITRAKIKLTSQVGQGVIYNLRRELFIHLQELPFSYFDDKPHGKIQVRVVNYVNNLSDLLSNGIVNTITDIFSMIFIVVYMLYLDVRFTLIVLCGMPVLVFIIVFIKSRQHKAWQIQSNKQSNLNAYIAESVNGIRVTQSFVREEYNTDYFNTLNKEAQKSWLTAVKYNFILWPVINNINVISASIIYVLGIGWLARGNVTITAGLLIAFAGYASRFWQPIMT